MSDANGNVDLPLDHVYVPPEGEGTAPAVFVLHGRGADEEDLLPIARQLPAELAVVSLRAPDRLQGGYTWYELDLSAGGLHRSQPDPDDFRRSLDLVVESVDAAVEGYGLDPDRIGLLGFSQGAITGLSLLVEDPARYAWVVALHGYLAASHADRTPDIAGSPASDRGASGTSASPLAGKPVFVGAGTADRVIPASRAETAAERLRELGADVTHGTYAVGHGVGREELDDVVAFVEKRL